MDGVSLDKAGSTKKKYVSLWRKSNMENHIVVISKTVSRNIGILAKLKHYEPE